MTKESVYTCLLADGENKIILQPFIAFDDDSAFRTVRNAIREDENIRTIAMQERISLHKVCEIVSENNSLHVIPCKIDEYLADCQYFRRFAQVVYGEQAVQKANEMEATEND